MTSPSLRQYFFAEMFGTFCLVFAGTGAVVCNAASGGAVSHLGIALTFGLIVLALIYALGDISGAHLNPAVTIAFAIAKRFPSQKIGAYVLAQFLGAIGASLCLRLLFPNVKTLGETVPAGPTANRFFWNFCSRSF